MRKFLVRQVRDDSPDQQRPKWVSAVKSPLRGGTPSTVADGLIAAGPAPPSPGCVDSTVAVGARYDPWLVLARRPHSRTLPPFLAYQWPPSGYHR